MNNGRYLYNQQCCRHDSNEKQRHPTKRDSKLYNNFRKSRTRYRALRARQAWDGQTHPSMLRKWLPTLFHNPLFSSYQHHSLDRPYFLHYYLRPVHSSCSGNPVSYPLPDRLPMSYDTIHQIPCTYILRHYSF